MGLVFFDGWSITHFLWGYAAAKTQLFTPITFLLAHTIFEIWENTPEGIQWFQDYGFPRYKGDTLNNTLGDTFFAMLGFFSGR